MARIVSLIPAAHRRAAALAEVLAQLRASDQRPLAPDELKRLREAEARANRRFGA